MKTQQTKPLQLKRKDVEHFAEKKKRSLFEYSRKGAWTESLVVVHVITRVGVGGGLGRWVRWRCVKLHHFDIGNNYKNWKEFTSTEFTHLINTVSSLCLLKESVESTTKNVLRWIKCETFHFMPTWTKNNKYCCRRTNYLKRRTHENAVPFINTNGRKWFGFVLTDARPLSPTFRLATQRLGEIKNKKRHVNSKNKHFWRLRH